MEQKIKIVLVGGQESGVYLCENYIPMLAMHEEHNYETIAEAIKAIERIDSKERAKYWIIVTGEGE